MGNNHISIIRYHVLLMVIGKAKELDSIYFYSAVLKKVNVLRKILDTLCIPKTEVVITSNEYLMRIRQFDVPIQKVKHLILSTIIADVTAMNDDISLR